jgi:sugar lactone lactonase YvrE
MMKAQRKWSVTLSVWLVATLTLALLVLSLFGCGGGKSSPLTSPSVSSPPEISSDQSIATARFFVDVKTRQVTVTPVSGTNKTTKGRTIFTGTAINFVTSTLLDHPGNPGIKVIRVALVNRTNITIGQFPNGVVTGVRVLFSPINPVGSFSNLRPLVTVSTFAGTGSAGTTDGHVGSATFSEPSGVAVDSSGNLYVTDYTGHRIRKIQGGFVSTLAGSGVAGYANGVGTSASFNAPFGIAFNPVGNSLVVAEYSGNRIRRVTLDGRVSLIAGTGTAGDADGAGNAAQFRNPAGVVVDSNGVIYVSDGHRIRKIVFTGSDPTNPSHYTVSTLAGSGVAGFADGVGTAARFNVPRGLAISADGTIYVADQGNYRIRRVSPTGEVVTIAGTGVSGVVDGSGDTARFSAPYGIVWVNGSLIVSEGVHVLRQVRLKEPNAAEGRASSWLVQTIAGSSGVSGSADGSGVDARFNTPRLLAVDRSGNIYVADAYNHKIRKVTPNSGFFPVGLATGSASSETVRLWNADGYYPNPSGEPVAYVEYSGVLKGGAMSEAKEWAFVVPKGVTAFEFTVTVEANTVGTPPDAGDSNVGSPNVLVRTILWNEKGGSGGFGFDVTGNADGPLALARFGIIADIEVDRFGNLYIADNWRRSIRRISANGIVTTVAGGRAGYQDGPGNVARFGGDVLNLAVSPDGTEIFCPANNVIRRIALIPGSDPTNPANWIVSTIAGVPDGVPGFNNGAGDVARFAGPQGIAMDEGGNLYVTETMGWDTRYDPPRLVGGHRVRVIVFKGGDRSDPKSWEVRSVAGDPAGNEGDADGVGKDARFSNPTQIVVDRWGNLYVSEPQKRRIRKITNALGYEFLNPYGSGVVTTFVNNLAGSLAVDAAGYLYVANNYRVYRVSPSGSISVVAGTGEPGAQDGPGNTAKFNLLGAIAVDSSGNIYVSDNEWRSESPNIFNLRLRIIQRVIGSGSP